MESMYNSIIVIFILAIALLKSQVLATCLCCNYHSSFTGSISVISFIIYFAFKMTFDNNFKGNSYFHLFSLT